MASSYPAPRALPVLTLPAKIVAAVAAVACAVAFPQLLQGAGAAFGLSADLGCVLLPMHLPVMLAGFVAGPWAGLAAGLLSSFAGFFASGMPPAARLPFMALELGVCGLAAGFVRGRGIPALAKVLAAQLAGRAALLAVNAAIALASGALGLALLATQALDLFIGLPGLLLQWAATSAVLALLARRERDDGGDSVGEGEHLASTGWML